SARASLQITSLFSRKYLRKISSASIPPSSARAIASRSNRESSALIFLALSPVLQHPNLSNEILRRETISSSSLSKSANTLPPCNERQKLQGRLGITGKVSMAML